MNSHPPFFSTSTVLMIAVLASTLVVLASCNKNAPDQAAPATTNSVTDANVADKVQQATTPADHQDLATYYDAQAQAAEQDTGADRELRGRYERHWRPGDHPMGRGAVEPYDHLIKGHGDDAREYRSLARWHREMAQQAEPSAAGE